MFIAAILMLERSDVVKRPLHLSEKVVVSLSDKMTTIGVPLLLHPSVLHFCFQVPLIRYQSSESNDHGG